MDDKTSLERSYFDKIYESSPDPWSFETSPYEAEKYATTISLLDSRKFSNALEIGCSIGILTSMLAPFCQRLLAVDTSLAALQQAQKRNADLAQIRFSQMNMPTEFPNECFSLIVLSEVGYYWDEADDRKARNRIAAALEYDGLLILVHYLPEVADYPRNGDAVHQAFLQDERFHHQRQIRKELYRADTFTRAR